MTRLHAFASASNSKTWMSCTAQPGFVERERARGTIPAQGRDSKSSLSGTQAHEFASACLMLGSFELSLAPDREMGRLIKGYVETVQRWKEDDGWDLYVETEVPLFYYPEESGFMDAAVIKQDGTAARFGDLKWGIGIPVDARFNTQLAIYALSSIIHFSSVYPFTDKTLITLMVYQPRTEGEERAVKLWVITLRELKEFCVNIGSTAKAIYANPNGGVFKPSDSVCQFCDAAPVCSARARQLLGLAPEEAVAVVQSPVGSDFTFPSVESLTLAQLVRLVQVAPEMKAWLSSCEEAAFGLLLSGKPFPGYKLVAGQSVRKWRDEDEALELLATQTELPAEEHYTIKVITPPQAQEKLSKKDWDAIKHAVIKPEGGPTMVPENDPRPAFAANPAEIFPNLAQDTGSPDSGNLLLL